MGAATSNLFKALSDQTRRDILVLLYRGDKTAGEIAANFQMTKPSISHHLNILRTNDLVSSERRGQEIWYSLNVTVLQEAVLGFWRFFEERKEEE